MTFDSPGVMCDSSVRIAFSVIIACGRAIKLFGGNLLVLMVEQASQMDKIQGITGSKGSQYFL